MAAEVKTEEPSIEEILESIRQIISEDTEESAPAAGPELKLGAVKEEPPAPSTFSIVPEKAALEPAPVPLSLTPDVARPVEKPAPLDLTNKINTPPPAAPQEPAPSLVTIEMMDSPMTEEKKEVSSLLSPDTANAVTDSLSKILAANVAVEEETAGKTGKVTLEDMARELMRPLIKTWLDQNLPGIIEKAVQKEVEKLARRAADR
jgi:cell pole-organizing protein PopZ